MMLHGFDMHRVYLSAPGDLEAEKQLCRAVISDVNETDAMKDQILLVSVGLREEGAVEQIQGPVADNIRQCAYFIQMFEDDWGPKNLMRKMFFVACDGLADEALPMREVAVFVKDAPREIDPEILAFRQELTLVPGVRLFRFATVADMREPLRAVISEWVAQIRASTPPAPPASA